MPRQLTQFSADGGVTAPASARRDWRSALGRFGLGARGVLYVVLGILALQFALGSTSDQQVSNRGAMQFIQQQPLGAVLLWVLAAGLAALASWQVVIAVTGDPVQGSGVVHRALFAIKGLAYAGVAVSAVAVARGGNTGSGGDNGQAEATAFVLERPLGRWIVGAIGVGVVGYAVWSVVKHVKNAEFMQRLATGRMDHDVVRAVRTSGRIGYAARATVIGLIGGFLVLAALQHAADRSRGLAGAVIALSDQAYGTWLLAGVAVGLALFGAFSVIEARHRRAA